MRAFEICLGFGGERVDVNLRLGLKSAQTADNAGCSFGLPWTLQALATDVLATIQRGRICWSI